MLNISRKHFYGVNILIDVLRGANSKRIVESQFNTLAEYGTLKALDREDIHCIIEWLIENNFILRTKHPKYPVLHSTYEGMHYDSIITNKKLKELLKILTKQ